MNRYFTFFLGRDRAVFQQNAGWLGFGKVEEEELINEPLWSEQSILTLGRSIKFVAEVVSNNWQNDYARKVEDYAAFGICEYWIADYAGLGGIRYIGKPKQPTLSCFRLLNGEYEMQPVRGDQNIIRYQKRRSHEQI